MTEPNPQMTVRERYLAAVAGEPVDRPPISLWRQFPNMDQKARDLTHATLLWQEAFGFDFVKFMPAAEYPIIDWGGKSEYDGNPNGTRTITHAPIGTVDDWGTIKPLYVQRGFNGIVLSGLRGVRLDLGPVIPLLHTIHSPLTVAMKLSNNRVFEHLRANPDAVHTALTVITQVTKDMVDAAFAGGADGIFYATRAADFDLLDEVEAREFGLRYDLDVLAAVADRGNVLLHIHGNAPMFDLGRHYPAQMLNWHDRRAAPNLGDGQRQAGRCVAGGIDETTIETSTPEEVAAQVRDAIAQTGGRHMFVSAGCIIPPTTPPENTQAAIDAVRSATVE
jgi:uroporphyrinogen decarboxylase